MVRKPGDWIPNPTGKGGPKLWAKERKEKFCKELCLHSNISAAARAAGVNRCVAYHQRAKDPEFAEQWDHARKTYAEDVLEKEADRRAVEGVFVRFHYDKDGNQVGEERRYSDLLLIARLNALKKEEYRSESAHKIDVSVTIGLEERLSKALKLVESKRGSNDVKLIS